MATERVLVGDETTGGAATELAGAEGVMARLRESVTAAEDVPSTGHVTRMTGLTIESRGPFCTVGELCWIFRAPGSRGGNPAPILAEVVGFHDRAVQLMPLGDVEGIGPGCRVETTGRPLQVRVSEGMLGRIVDGLGRPLDGRPLASGSPVPVDNRPPKALDRQRISEPISLGIRAIDSLITCGKGQRLGIFAGSGVGKSSLLSMMARNTDADVTCIGLIGERGREVREFIDNNLGPEGLARSVVVVATADEPAVVRIKAAQLVTAVAEWFRDAGKDVLLLMDSVTRVAMAQREIGLAIGEPPTSRGYTPSVFALLARLLERTGPGSSGTITGLYTVLVEGDDLSEPISDTVRSILDGHVVLARRLAERNHYPAIDVLASVSRLMNELASADQRAAAANVREILSTYADAEDLVNIGAYVAGANPRIDRALARIDDVHRYLRQEPDEAAALEASLQRLVEEFG